MEIQINFIVTSINYFINYKLNHLSLQLLSLLLGFFISTALSTIPAQTGDWGIIAAAIIVTNQEIVSKIIYQTKINSYYKSILIVKILLKYCNNIKIGILYGLFVDAFKLGS
uniref:Uncharacterized protein ycf20 n=1 Tax=Calliarthron tuberculosum TaxID=48942 RepID=M4IU88_CALTB|nr:conserved hypothetical plastid protein [Calliarthron tuberculosum]AGA63913.1 conserved hypothetical plastid protein [Calliarthron tuberculosum]